MSPDPLITRRRVLAAGAGTAGIAVLAACSSSSGGSTADSSEPAAAGDSTTGSRSAPAGSSPSSSGGSSSSPPAAASADAIATLSDVPVGGAISVKLPNGKPGIVGRPTATTAVCFSAICTHQGCTVKPAGKLLDCPCHGSKFDALTGAVVNPPAPSPLEKVAVAVQGGKVVAT